MSEIYNKLLEYMKRLQPSANKKEKKKTFDEILKFINNNDFTEKDFDLLFRGEESQKIIGLPELCGKKNSMGEFKDSAKKVLQILHDLMYLSRKSEAICNDFVIYDDEIRLMHLGEHYSISKKKDPKFATTVLEVIKVVIDKRPQLELCEYVQKKIYADEIQKGIKQYSENKKTEDSKNVQKNYVMDYINQTTDSIYFEPKTWDDVLKLKNKKLLTTEFLSINYNTSKNKDKPTFIDEDKEMEEEIINNFIDPLTVKSDKLDLKAFSEQDVKKLHLQFETFDPVFFLEKFYSNASLHKFSECLGNLENNLQQVNLDDENLIDKNIYKYLDCKKLLDSLFDKFKKIPIISSRILKTISKTFKIKLLGL